ncbi:hypothetical protein G7Y89_g3817 [Cudoniella acicularis]|uniref:NACHT domain-containing protein n=1 Tax=Cudoniella acicularis TaxID=354080 RepID=A0A8H4W4U7_9HELO|nr:hypothetical protein G7Y89_g3817 [Cudoniella acicularis]
MSFGFGTSDFIAVIELVINICERFIGAPEQFKALSKQKTALSNILREMNHKYRLLEPSNVHGFRESHEETIGIAYIYCNYDQQEEQNAVNLLSNLLKQLAQNLMPEEVKYLYKLHRNKRTRPSIEEITRTLQSVANTYSRVFVIVDGLDEWQESKLSISCRTRFLSEVFSLQENCKINFFVTSRFIPDITEIFTGKVGQLSLEIRASNDDIRKYLDNRILQGQSRLLPLLQIEITSEIIKAVDGMFDLAELFLEALSDMKTPKDIRTALKNLQMGSDAYDSAYREAMNRIERQGRKSVELAKQVLSWITCAKRPLTKFQLQHALGVEIGKPIFDKENLSLFEEMVSVCAGLVTIDNESGVIRFVHYTAQETCLTYLLYNDFERGFCQTEDEFEERLQRNPLCDYAARYWAHHASKAPIHPMTIEFLESDLKVEASVQALFATKRHYSHQNYSQEVPRNVTGSHLAAYFGLEEAMKELYKRGHSLDLKDSELRTPLSYAAENGHEAIVKFLLTEGSVDIDPRDYFNLTPLYWAAKFDHAAVVELFLATGGVNLDPKDEGRTMLSYAIHNHNCKLETVETLLKLGAPTNLVDIDNMTPLHHTIKSGRKDIAHAIIRNGCAVDIAIQRGAWGSETPEGRTGHEITSAEPDLTPGLTNLQTEVCALGGIFRHFIGFATPPPGFLKTSTTAIRLVSHPQQRICYKVASDTLYLRALALPVTSFSAASYTSFTKPNTIPAAKVSCGASLISNNFTAPHLPHLLSETHMILIYQLYTTCLRENWYRSLELISRGAYIRSVVNMAIVPLSSPTHNGSTLFMSNDLHSQITLMIWLKNLILWIWFLSREICQNHWRFAIDTLRLNRRAPMRISPNGIPTPRPMARDLELEGLEDGDEIAEEVLGGAVSMGALVVGGDKEDVVGEVGVAVAVDVRSCPCRTTIVPTGIEKALPDSQQLVPFGPQQYVIVPAPVFSPPRHGNKLFPNGDEELPRESQRPLGCKPFQLPHSSSRTSKRLLTPLVLNPCLVNPTLLYYW